MLHTVLHECRMCRQCRRTINIINHLVRLSLSLSNICIHWRIIDSSVAEEWKVKIHAKPKN